MRTVCVCYIQVGMGMNVMTGDQFAESRGGEAAPDTAASAPQHGTSASPPPQPEPEPEPEPELPEEEKEKQRRKAEALEAKEQGEKLSVPQHGPVQACSTLAGQQIYIMSSSAVIDQMPNLRCLA